MKLTKKQAEVVWDYVRDCFRILKIAREPTAADFDWGAEIMFGAPKPEKGKPKFTLIQGGLA